MTSGGFTNEQTEVRDIHMLACTFPGEGFSDLEEAKMHEVLNSHAAELTEENLEQLTLFNEPEEGEDSKVIAKRLNLTTSVLEKGLQISVHLVDHFFEVDHFLNKYLKFKCERGAVAASCREVYEDTQIKANNQRSPIFSLSLLSLLLQCIPHCLITLRTFSQEY